MPQRRQCTGHLGWKQLRERSRVYLALKPQCKPKMNKRRRSWWRWNRSWHSCRRSSRPTSSLTLHRCRKDIETLRNKAAKARDRKSLAAEVAETRAYLDRENKRISDLEEIQKSLEEKLTERRSEAAKARATLQKLEEQLAQELTGPKSSMDVDLGATTPLPPSTVDEEVYKMEREALELLRELHMQGVCQESTYENDSLNLISWSQQSKKRKQNDP